MRLFIAIPLSNEMKRRAAEVQDMFRSHSVRGNYTPAENLHITLAFIGEYHDSDEVLDALSRISFQPFSLTMDHIGCFGELWWTGFEKSNELEALAGKVRRALAEAGIPFDRKRFKAHVTILRKPVYMGKRMGAVEFEPARMRVEKISLMRSDRGRHGMIYTELGTMMAEPIM